MLTGWSMNLHRNNRDLLALLEKKKHIYRNECISLWSVMDTLKKSSLVHWQLLWQLLMLSCCQCSLLSCWAWTEWSYHLGVLPPPCMHPGQMEKLGKRVVNPGLWITNTTILRGKSCILHEQLCWKLSLNFFSISWYRTKQWHLIPNCYVMF